MKLVRLVCVPSFEIESLDRAAAGDKGSFSTLVLRRLEGVVGTANLPDLSIADCGPTVSEDDVAVRLCGESVLIGDRKDVDNEAL